MRYAIILCSGKAQRASLGFNKIFFPLGQGDVLSTTLNSFSHLDKIIITANKDDYDKIKKIYKNCLVVLGAETRTQSVINALNSIKNIDEQDVVLIHDGCRPFVTKDLVDRCVISAERFKSGVAAVKVIDSIKNKDYETLKKEELIAVQTPQAFNLKQIISAYKNVKGNYEDDSQVYKLAGYDVKIVEGDYLNKKLTNPSDFFSSHELIGTGFDVHKLVKNRKLILGAVEIPFKRGLKGHSDADVLIHSIMDSILSASNLPDIGVLFPDTDNKFLNISSAELLKKVMQMIEEKRVKINYISSVIICQKPKLAPYIDAMRESLADIIRIKKNKINISATTTEFLGIIGKGRAIASSSVCLASHF